VRPLDFVYRPGCEIYFKVALGFEFLCNLAYLGCSYWNPVMDDIYNTKLLEFAASIPLLTRLDTPQATAKAHSKLCGSTVTVDLSLAEDGRVVEFAHEVKACALGQASASILAQHIIGATQSELRTARKEMLAMLKEGGEPPSGRFAELKYLQPVKDYKARHASTMLPFDAVIDCLDQIEVKTGVQSEAAA
jgi:NifU-like protein involved in Fe-S cluster formation